MSTQNVELSYNGGWKILHSILGNSILANFLRIAQIIVLMGILIALTK